MLLLKPKQSCLFAHFCRLNLFSDEACHRGDSGLGGHSRTSLQFLILFPDSSSRFDHQLFNKFFLPCLLLLQILVLEQEYMLATYAHDIPLHFHLLFRHSCVRLLIILLLLQYLDHFGPQTDFLNIWLAVNHFPNFTSWLLLII